MYPLHYANLFPPFPRNEKVFVAMSFASQFNHRWENVIKPGVNRVEINGVKLEAYRVDVSVVGDSILTEVLQGITNARLVLADLSTLHVLNDTACRNANVLYEVGIAQALRMPEEVLLFRSDRDRLLFDLANVRVHYYDPDNAEQEAIDKVATFVSEALKELDFRKNVFVQRAADSLDGPCMDILLQIIANGDGIVEHPAVLHKLHMMSAISRMLELGILKFETFKITKELIEATDIPFPYKYRMTHFGESVFRVLFECAGWGEPGMWNNLCESPAVLRAAQTVLNRITRQEF